MPKPKSDIKPDGPKDKRLVVRMTEEMHAELKLAAKRAGWSMNDEVLARLEHRAPAGPGGGQKYSDAAPATPDTPESVEKKAKAAKKVMEKAAAAVSPVKPDDDPTKKRYPSDAVKPIPSTTTVKNADSTWQPRDFSKKSQALGGKKEKETKKRW